MFKRLRRRRSKKIGLSPGSLVHIGEQKVEEVNLSLINYNLDVYPQKLILKQLSKIAVVAC